jgi:Kef-type K+ transport system membrane component KefB
MNQVFPALPVIFEIGLVILLAVISAEIQSRVGIPQVLGFILTGIILGPFILGIVSPTILELASPVTTLALGFIGFNIGHEIKLNIVRKEAKRLLPLLICESLGTFLIVSIVMFAWLQEPVLAILFGSLASATAPAATADVVWEYKAQGPVTDRLMFILAADDVISIVLVSVALSFTTMVYNPMEGALLIILVAPIIEIGLSIVLGAISGVLLAHFLGKAEDPGRFFTYLISGIILLIGLAELIHISDIFSCMVFGIVLGNSVPERAQKLSHDAEKIFSPVILLFFVLFGAQIDPSLLSAGILIIITAVIYIISRTGSKYFGTRVGALIGKNPYSVSRYLGLCLLSQAGVAVGLSVVISDRLTSLGAANLGSIIIGVIGISTLVFQIFGPLATKRALHKADEVRLPAV